MLHFKTRLFRWLQEHNEYVPLFIALLLFLFSPIALRFIDPTAGTYDVGVLQVMILAVISFCVFQAVVWMTLKVNWLPLRKYFEHDFTDDFFNLTPCQKITISLSVYFFLFLLLVLLSKAI
jgi:hypothetical protein